MELGSHSSSFTGKNNLVWNFAAVTASIGSASSTLALLVAETHAWTMGNNQESHKFKIIMINII